MKLSVSNIIWKKGRENFEDFLKNIVKNDVFAVELSLSSIFEEPYDITKDELEWLKKLLKYYDVSVSSLHSLTFTRPDLELFNTSSKREELCEYILRYVELARELNSNNLVYGSPKSRKTYGKTDIELDNIFVDFLYKIDEKSAGVNFNIEPLPKEYCEYLNTFMQAVDIFKKNSFKNIYVQLDIRSIIESMEDIDEIFEYQKYIKHVHVGEPNLKMSVADYADVHSLFNKKLVKMGYNSNLSIEVLNHEQDNFEEYLKSTIKRVRNYYGS